MTMGSLLSSIISNIFIENFEKTALEETDLIPKIWLRCIHVHHMATWKIQYKHIPEPPKWFNIHHRVRNSLDISFP
jgi:hypothetical protein